MPDCPRRESSLWVPGAVRAVWHRGNGFKLTFLWGWFSEKLEKVRDLERQEETFSPMPSPHYMELTKLLLNQ